MAKQPKVEPLPVQWHPDFRNKERLPDLSVVRSGTILHIVSFALVVAAALFLAYQELSIRTTQQSLASLEADVAAAEEQLKVRVALGKQFESVAAKVEALAAHGEGRPLGSDVLRLLAQLRLNEVIFSSVEISPREVRVRIRAMGRDLDALLLLPAAQVRQFAESRDLSDLYPRIDPPVFDPPRDGVLEFEIILRR
jgi:hypothetical protein